MIAPMLPWLEDGIERGTSLDHRCMRDRSCWHATPALERRPIDLADFEPPDDLVQTLTQTLGDVAY